MKAISLLASVAFAFCSWTAGGATMAISTNPGTDVTVKFTFASANVSPATSSFVFETPKGLLGPTSNPTDQSGFKNWSGNLFAICVMPATKSAFVYFFLTSSKGDLNLVNDVNARVAKFLPQPWRDDAKGFLRVEKIQGRKVRLETIDYAHAPFKTHTFWVKVDAEGEITLAP